MGKCLGMGRMFRPDMLEMTMVGRRQTIQEGLSK
jgi:hypothetical protein